MRRYAYFRPRTLDEAWKLRAEHAGARLIAGGTDLLVHAERPAALVSLRSIPELTGIEVGDTTRIGALTPVADLTRHEALAERYPVLVQAARRLGSVQIRNVATLGGNLCRAAPCADTAPPLLVLDALVRARSPRGERVLPLQEFFLGPAQTCLAPDEVLTRVEIPPLPPGARGLFLKKGRVRMDLSLASVALLLAFDGDRCRHARVAAGSVAPVPLRLPEVEALLAGERIGPERIDAAADAAARAVAPITDIRASEDYRRDLVRVFVRRGLLRLRAEAGR